MNSNIVESLIITAWIVGPIIALAIVAAIGDRYLDRRYRQNLTPVETPHDFDDWRDPIREFRVEQYIRAIRRRFAVAAVCGADPENSEDRSVAPAGPRTPHGGLTSHESLRGQ